MELLPRYYDYLRYELNRAPLTVQAYQTDLDQFCDWLTGESDSFDPVTVTSSDIRAWLSSLAKAGDSPRTLRRKIVALRSFFRWLMKSGIISRSPLQDIPLPKIAKPLPNFIKADEMEKVIKELAGNETPEDNTDSFMQALIVEMLYSLGIRRAELIGLDDSDVSFSKAEIKVTGKRSKQRIIPVPENLLEKIRRWQELRDNDQENLDADSPLFTVKGRRITPNQVYKIVHTALLSTSARKKSPHALRHSFASAMLNGGAEMDTVREFLGHSSLATTQIYTHISIGEMKKAYSTAHPRSRKNKE